MLNGNNEQALQEVNSPQFVPGPPDGPADNAFAHRPPRKEKPEAVARSRQERPAGEPQRPELPAETDEQPAPPPASSGESGKGFRSRHPIAVVSRSVLFALSAGTGCSYSGYTWHFQSTDAALIA